ncbi:MAG: LysE family translocator [Litorimonas sp.]
MSVDVWLSLVVIFFVGGLTPGPAVALVLASAFRHGFKRSMLAALGIASANIVWLLLAASGAMALLTAYPQAFIFMKVIGILVILYLALTTIFGPLPDLSSSPQSSAQPTSRVKLYTRGIALQLSSPMPLVYFGGLLPTYFDSNLPFPKQIFIMFVTITITELVGLAIYALGAQHIKAFLTSPKAARGFNIIIGLLMIGSGFWAIFLTTQA